MFRPRHYLSTYRDPKQGIVRVDQELKDGGQIMISETVLRLAFTEYARRFRGARSYEHMQDRGGLSVLEIVNLLADYVERLGVKPSEPREK